MASYELRISLPAQFLSRYQDYNTMKALPMHVKLNHGKILKMNPFQVSVYRKQMFLDVKDFSETSNHHNIITVIR